MRKQGRADRDVSESQKREPIPRAVSPGGAAQLGTIVFQNPEPLYAGRGFEAPKPNSISTHKAGSQGKHR